MSGRAERIPAWALSYDTGDHPPYAYTADVVGLAINQDGDGLDVLLIERGAEPFQGLLAMPGGFVNWERDPHARQAALRELKEETGSKEPDYIEALDTYDTNGRDPRQFAGRMINGQFVRRGNRVVSRTDLALFRSRHEVHPVRGDEAVRALWSPVISHLPWEDVATRAGRAVRKRVLDALQRGAAKRDAKFKDRITQAFGAHIGEWNEERAGERMRIIIEAGIVEEGVRDRWGSVLADAGLPAQQLGVPMAFDHRIMLADAIGRVRGKIKYVPALLAALMPQEFTVADLQRCVEAIAGRPLEAANFRRLIAYSKSHALIRPTGLMTSSGGRPAEMFTWFTDFAHVRLERSLRLPWLALEHGG